MADTLNPTLPNNTPSVPEIVVAKTGPTISTPIQVGYTGYGQSQYDKQPLTFENLQQLNEIRAQEQTALDKLGNGLVNMTISAFTGALDSTVGFVYGISKGLITGEADQVWNNEFGQAMDSINEAVRESNPFYYSEAEKNASLLGSMGYQNFWFDKVLGGAGYTIGSLAAGYGISSLFKMGKAAQLAQIGDETIAAGRLSTTAEGIGAAAASKGRWDLTKEMALGTVLAHGESSMEARQSFKEALDFYNEARALGDPSNPDFNPEYAQYASLTDKQIEQLATDVGNTNYLINMPITGGTNLLLLGKFINPGKKAAIKQYNSIGTRTLAEGTTEYFDKVAAQKGAAYFNFGKKFVEGFLPESLQEGAQYASNIASREFVDQYQFSRDAWADAFYEGAAEGISSTLTDREGLESILIGGIVGGPFGLKGVRAERLAKNENTKKLVDALNADPNFTQSNKLIGEYLGSVRDANKGEEYLKKGDLFSAKNETDKALNRYIKAQIDAGTTDYFVTRLQSMKDIDPAELEKHFGPGTTTEDIDKIVNKTAELQKLNDNLTTLYGISSGTPEQRTTNQKIRDRFFFAASTIKDVEARTKNIEQEILDLKDAKASKLLQMHKNIFTIADTVTPENVPFEKTYEQYLKELKSNAIDSYTAALKQFEAESPVEGAALVNLFADLNKLTERKGDFVKYYNALQDPAKALEVLQTEDEAFQAMFENAEQEENNKQTASTLKKQSNLPPELINDVFVKDVNRKNIVTDLNGKELDLASMDIADLRGFREEIASEMLINDRAEELAELDQAVAQEISSRENVTANTLAEELAQAKSSQDVEAIVAKAEENGYTVSSDKVRAIHQELIKRQNAKDAETKEDKKVKRPFKDIREYLNTFVIGEQFVDSEVDTPSTDPLDGMSKAKVKAARLKAQQALDDLLINDPAALDEITLDIRLNTDPLKITKVENAPYAFSGSPLTMAIQHKGKDIAYIPYYGKFVNEEGIPLDPTLMSYEEWKTLFSVEINEETGKGTKANFQEFVKAYQEAKKFFDYVYAQLLQGKNTYNTEELIQLINPQINKGFFEAAPDMLQAPMLEQFDSERPVYRDADNNLFIVDTNTDKSLQQMHVDPATLETKEEYKAALEALAERKAMGKIHNTRLLQRYVALVEHPYGTVSIKGDNKKYEWVPLVPSQYPIDNLLNTLKTFQEEKTATPKEMATLLNSEVFFSLRSGWDVGLYFSEDFKQFTLEFKFGSEPSVFANVTITPTTTANEFITKLNESLQDPKRPQQFQGKPAVDAIRTDKNEPAITVKNFKTQIPTQLPDLNTDAALQSFYPTVTPNVKTNLSFRINYSTPAQPATQAPTPTQPSAAPVSNKKANPRGQVKIDPTKLDPDAQSSGEVRARARDLTKAFAYIRSVFGDSIGVTVLDALEERLANGSVLYGDFKDNLIRLSRFSPEGTEYHEAFHGVFRAFLTDQEIAFYRDAAKQQMRDELKKKNISITSEAAKFSKEFYAKNPGTKFSEQEIFNLMLEEYMADKYKAHRMAKETKAKTGLAGILQTLWEKLSKVLDIFVKSKQADAFDGLFEAIDNGTFKNKQMVSNQFTGTVLPAQVSLFAGSSFEKDVNGNNVLDDKGNPVVIPTFLPEHISNQIIGTVISNVYNAAKLKPNVPTSKLIDEAINAFHDNFNLDTRSDYIDASTNEKAKDLFYSIEFALNPESYINEPGFPKSPRTEIKNAVEAALKSFDVDLVVEENEGESNDEVSKKGDTESKERNRDLNQENLGGFKNLSKKLRAYISLTTYTTSLNDFFGVPDVFPEDVTMTIAVDTKRVYNGIAKATQNSLTSKEVMTKLIHYRNVSSEPRYVIDKFLNDIGFPLESFLKDGNYSESELKPANLDLYHAMVKGFNLHSHDHTFTEYDFNLGIARSYSSNRKTADQQQFESWNAAYVKAWQKWGKTPEEKIATAKAKIVDKLTKASNAININTPKELSNSDVMFRVTNLDEALKSVGISLSQGYLKFLVLNNPNYAGISDIQKSYVESFGYSLREDQPYIVTTIDELVKHISTGKNPFVRDVEQVKKDGKEKEVEVGLVSRILVLAKNNELFDETLSPNSFLNAENKTIYSLQKPTADSIITLAIARDRMDLLPLDYQSEYFKDHYLLKNANFQKIKAHLKLLREDGARVRYMKINQFGQFEVDTFKESEEGSTFGDYKARELALAEYSHYLDSRFDGIVGNNEVEVRPVVLDIMENSKSLNMVPLPVVDTIDKQGKITDKFKDAIVAEVRREFNRIQVVKSQGSNPLDKIEGFNWGAVEGERNKLRGFKFWHFENLLKFENSDLLKELEAASAGEFDQYIPALKEQIEKYFTAQIDTHLDELAKLGVVKKGYKDGKPIYINVLLDTRYGRRDYISGGKWLSETTETRNKILKAMTDQRMKNPFTSGYAGDNIAQVFLNNYLNRLSYNQLIKGDAAQVVKNPIDWFKRAKARNASGDSLYSEMMPETRFAIIGKRAAGGKIEDPSKQFTVTNRVLDMNNPEDQAEFKEVLDSIQNDDTLTQAQKEKKLADIRKKGKVDIADAQGYISARAAMNYLYGLGRLTEKTRAIYNDIIEGKPISPEDWTTLKKENVMANSMKLVYHDGVRFFKLSVQTLSREEVSVEINGERVARPGMEVKFNMLQQMEQHGIDLLMPPSASKMLTENVVEMDANDMFSVPDPTRQVGSISNLFGRLQQENPSNKDQISNPTQMQNIIEVEQDRAQKIEYPFYDNIKTVGDLLDLYDSAQAQKVTRSYIPAKSIIFALQEGKTNPKMGRLAKIMRESLIKTGATGQLLDFFKVDSSGVPVFDFANMPHTTAKFEAMYNAHFNKVFSQKIPGYKTTLQSGFGHQIMFYEKADGTEVIVNKAMFDENPEKYMADYKAGRLKTRDLAYNKPRLDKNGKEIGKYSEFVMSAHFAEQFGLKAGDIIPEEIAYMFGLRIPSQDKHSAMSLKLVDILPNFTGSNAVFPHEIVKLTGSDFDIDSFYIHRPDHYVKYVNGKPKFMVYGNTEDSEFDQFLQYYTNDKFVDLLVKEYITEDIEKNGANTKELELKQILRNIIEELSLGEEMIVNKEELINEKAAIKQKLRDLNKQLVLRALKELGLPSNAAEYAQQTKEKGELNPGTLNNTILNAKIVLHSNPAVRKITSTPATIDEVETILDEIAKAKGFESYDEMDVKHDVSTLTALMQALDSNRAGQESIGAAVNATQIFGRLREFNIKIGELFLENLPKINGFTSEGYTSYQTQDGKRVMDILSTLTSAMTDNPKYGFVNKLGLSIDALSNVSNLVGLGYSLRDALYLINQDYVKKYTQFVANKRNKIRPLGEKYINTSKYYNSLLEDIKKKIKEIAPNATVDLDSNEFTTEELLNALKERAADDKQAQLEYLVANYKALTMYSGLEPITKTFSKIGSVIKITKGTGSTFEEEEIIIETLKQLGGKLEKVNGSWQIVKAKENKIMPNILKIFREHKLTKANLEVLADKRANTGKIAISQTPALRKMTNAGWRNIERVLGDVATKKNAIKKAALAFTVLRAYSIQQKSTVLNTDNISRLLYKLEDSQAMLLDEYKELSEKYPEFVGQSPALYSLGFRPQTSNGFMGINYNSTKGNVEFETRLTNDLENLYAAEHTREFVIKLFNYLVAKDALQFKNNSFINIMPAAMFKAYSRASKGVLELLNKEATEQEYKEMFGKSLEELTDEFVELSVRDAANYSNLLFYKEGAFKPEMPVTKNEDGSITFDMFKGWQAGYTATEISAIQEESVDPETGEVKSWEEVKKSLQGKVQEENLAKFISNLTNLNEMFALTTEVVGGKSYTRIKFLDGFRMKDSKGVYVLKSVEVSKKTKEGVEFTEKTREADGSKVGIRATYVLKETLGDKYNKVVPYGIGLEEAEKVAQSKLPKKEKTQDINGESEPLMEQANNPLDQISTTKAQPVKKEAPVSSGNPLDLLSANKKAAAADAGYAQDANTLPAVDEMRKAVRDAYIQEGMPLMDAMSKVKLMTKEELVQEFIKKCNTGA